MRVGVGGVRGRLDQEVCEDVAEGAARKGAYVEGLRRKAIAVATEAANEQHYEVDARFYERVLGKNLKYSACLYPEGVTTLDAAEDAMLELTWQRDSKRWGTSCAIPTVSGSGVLRRSSSSPRDGLPHQIQGKMGSRRDTSADRLAGRTGRVRHSVPPYARIRWAQMCCPVT